MRLISGYPDDTQNHEVSSVFHSAVTFTEKRHFQLVQQLL